MPILRKESDIYPADLLAIPLDVAPWEIVHVRSRQEKVVARMLAERGSPFYLPQIVKTVRRSGRTFKSHLPLFSGYVFIRRIAATRETLWATGVVVRVISVADQQLLDGELQQIRSLQQAGATLVPRPEIGLGHPVRITEGVFTGYTGTVVAERDVLRLIVSITSLNQSVLAELPRENVVAAARWA